ncbi:MAG: helix-turn-helix domain-containing protein [Clostridia bacterium]|nr:helix-turn-helix domain-containing protein [Clostridia bacterium]
MENNQSIGAKIVALRKEKGCTQADLGAYLNISYQAVSKWERGESCPDFVTMSKLAQYFNVSLEYFTDGEAMEEIGSSVAAESNGGLEREMLGVCKECGKVVYRGNEWKTQPYLLCKDCYERKEQERLEAEKVQRQMEEKERLRAIEEERLRLASVRHKRNKGFWIGGIIGGLIMAFFLIGTFQGEKKEIPLNIVLTVLFGGIGFMFVAQMVWDGAVRSCAGAGGTFVGTPGVIFTLDLDGLIFLIAVKILFAVLRLLVFILTSIVTWFAAFVISPFTFVPALIRMNKGIEAE